MKHILIAEDEPRIAEFLARNLQDNGFLTAIVSHGYEVIHLIHNHSFDLLILDLGLPDQDGLDIVDVLRGQGEQLPIIILTARNGVNDQAVSLKAGANDYVVKPFSFDDLLSRVELQLHPPPETFHPQEATCQIGDLVLDIRTRTVRVGDLAILLSNRELILLDTLMRRPNQILSRTDLLTEIGGGDDASNAALVDTYIERLTKKLGGNRIDTVGGRGYRLQPP